MARAMRAGPAQRYRQALELLASSCRPTHLDTAEDLRAYCRHVLEGGDLDSWLASLEADRKARRAAWEQHVDRGGTLDTFYWPPREAAAAAS